MSVGDLQEKWTSVGCSKSKLDELRAYVCCVDHLWFLYSLAMGVLYIAFAELVILVLKLNGRNFSPLPALH